MYSVFSQKSVQSQVCLSQLAAIANGLRSVLQSTQVNNSRQLKNDGRHSSELKNPSVNISQEVYKVLCLDYLPHDITVNDILHWIEPSTRWKESFVSSPTFFQNKTGFTQACLHNSGTCIHGLAASNLMKNRSLQHLCLPLVVVNQTRGFKMRTRESDIIDSSKESKSKISLGNIFDMNNPIFPAQKKSPPVIHSVLESDGTSKKLSNKINEAFYEGFMTGLKSNAEGKKTNYFKKFVPVLLVFGVLLIYFKFRQGINKMLGVNKFWVQPEFVKTSFKDVKGSDEAKEELEQVVDYLSDPDKYTRLGAKLPKGVLLVGPPGVGKTLLARAVAGEAGVPYFQASGAEFDEIFVGSGSRKIRELFGLAKENAPCVIFIDEIDSVGKKRSSESYHPYANQTVNQLLSEMDGFTENRGVIVIGATNKFENLDPAVTRAGRFDVTVHISHPDLKGRKELLEYYLAKVKTDKTVDIRSIASLTIGFSGADISNLVNQAALQATIEGSQTVQRSHLDFAYDKVSMGPAKKSKIPDKKVNLQTAYHEAGHTLVSYFTEEAMKVYKVTIMPRGSSLGHTRLLPEEDAYGYSKAQLLAKIDVSMGGQVAEELIYGKQNVSTGASSDLETATAIATSMVTKYGFNDKLGPRSIDMNSASSNLKEKIDTEIEMVLKASYQRARKVIEIHSNELEVLAQSLMKYETLDQKEIEDLLKGKKPDSFL